MILLNDEFSQLRIGQNVKESFPVNQIISCISGRVLEFQSFDYKLFSMKLVFYHH